MIKITWELIDYLEKVLNKRFKEYEIYGSKIVNLNDHVDRNYLVSYIICELADHIN